MRRTGSQRPLSHRERHRVRAAAYISATNAGTFYAATFSASLEAIFSIRPSTSSFGRGGLK